MSNSWFAVDKDGLQKLLDERGKEFVLFELLQNAWDTNALEVEVALEKVPGRPIASLRVWDNDPDGFRDLTHAYTLFAESEKKADPTKRGRFNLGEKLVLAVCKSASVSSTTGTILFQEDGTMIRTRTKRDSGSVFKAEVRMNVTEFEEVCRKVHTLIPPEGKLTIFNGQRLASWADRLVSTFEATLPTLKSNEEGVLTRTKRKTDVSIYKTTGGPGWIYEMGIPIVETGDTFHVSIGQKVPLNMDRDNVPPGYLKKVRAEVLNRTASALSKSEASESWVTNALESEDVEATAVTKTLDKRFGEKRAIFDPSDKEANMNLTARGYTIMGGGSLPSAAWQNIKRFGAATPAGKLAPTPKPFSSDPDAPIMEEIHPDNWSVGMREVADIVRWFAKELDISDDLLVRFGLPPNRGWAAAWGSGFTWNVTSLGKKWFAEWHEHPTRLLDIMVHEFAHTKANNHLEEAFHSACTKLGARVALLLFRHGTKVPHFKKVR